MDRIKLKDIKAETDEITNIKTDVGKMEARIKELETLVGKYDGTDHKNDTGIYKIVYDNFTYLMGE